MRCPLALCLLAAALSACGLDPSDDSPLDPPDGSTVELVSGAEVTISPGVKTCSRDRDCTLVWTGCDACCQQQAIRVDYREWYAEAFQQACASYSGDVCDCAPAPMEARCIEQTCKAVVTPPR